jgi:hypothetical protein
VLDELRERARTGRSARMLYEVLGDIWVVQRNPYLQDDLLDNPKRRALLVEALHHRLGESTSAARRGRRRRTRRATARSRSCCARSAVDASRAQFARTGACAKRRARACWARVTRRTTSSSTAWRASRTSPTPPTGASNIRSSCYARHRGRDGGAGARLHRTRPDHHSARRRHRLHRRRDSADRSAVINTEKLERCRASRARALPGVAQPVPTIDCGAGVVTQRVMEAAERAGLVFAVDPTSADASCIGGNVAMNAGGKKAVLWGTALDNLASWRMVTPDGKWLEVDAPRPQPRQDPRRAAGELRAAYFDATARSSSAPSGWTFPAQLPQGGLGKDVTDKFLAGLPGIQKEGCDGLITARASSCTRCRRTRAPSAWSSSARCATRCPAIVEIKDYLDAQGGPGGGARCSPASSTSTSAT